MKAYIITIAGIILSITSLILFLTLGQIFFVPLIFILPLSGTCFRNRKRQYLNDISIEHLKEEQHYYIHRCPHCSKIIHEESPNFCPHCGNSLNK